VSKRNVRATHRIINAVWVLEGEADDSTQLFEILAHYRDDSMPERGPRYEKAEDDKRRIIEVTIDGTLYEVMNPRNVFSYGENSGLEF